MKTSQKNKRLIKIAYAGLMAALCYVGYAVFPAITTTGTKIHIGNAFVVLGAFICSTINVIKDFIFKYMFYKNKIYSTRNVPLFLN